MCKGLFGYRYIEFSDFLKCFLRLGRNSDVLESNGLRIRFQREKIQFLFLQKDGVSSPLTSGKRINVSKLTK